MRCQETLLYISFSTFILTLFYGCSGHALQDLIDGDMKEEKQIEVSKESKAPTSVTPSKNSVLNSISPSATANDKHVEYRYIQKSTNTWIEEEWNPLTEQNLSDTKSNTASSKKDASNSNQTSDNNESNASFTLQYYVDKAGVYLENKKRRDGNKTKEPSHTEKVDEMPVVGKREGRR